MTLNCTEHATEKRKQVNMKLIWEKQASLTTSINKMFKPFLFLIIDLRLSLLM